MKKCLAALLIIFAGSAVEAQQGLRSGQRITRSATIKKSVYHLPAKPGVADPVIVIEGNNITVDFAGSLLRGNNELQHPDRFDGVAVLVRNSKNVRIRNLNARGYRVALLGRNVQNLVIENCDLSYNYRQRLNSTQEKEDISDWMSYHRNEEDQWLRYGAAIYLRDCDSAVVRNCRVTGGQNALLMTGCDKGRIYNNDFSFNSGIGIGMYRCNANEVAYNRVIFNVRGYSHGVYNRGQDSAGILVYEQSNYNVFYKNAVTHGGDGFFLWAGQTTMDTGGGGCNDNVLLENDFSYAPTNGIEVTFSRNRISGNRIFECDHGIWGGYSYNTTISGNQFRNNRIGIAIEHGQENLILNNLFAGDREAIRLWARKEQPSDWGYARARDTRSRDYRIAHNSFNHHKIVFNLNRTERLGIFANTYFGDSLRFKADSTVTGLDTVSRQEPDRPDTAVSIPRVQRPRDPFRGLGKFAGRKHILITAWGPYDYRYPIIWNSNPVDSGNTLRFEILGPAGSWKIRSFRGVKNVSAMAGRFPSSITAERIPAERTDISIELEYRGASFIDQFGRSVPGGRPHRFGFRKFFQPVSWEVNFYALDTAAHNPITTGQLFSPYEKKPPFRTERPTRLDYAWWGGIRQGANHYPAFITVGQGEAFFPEGEYELSVTWDDALRVYLDDSLIVDEWSPSKYTFDESPNRKVRLRLGGNHRFRAEHVELGGFATLSVKFRPLW